MWTMMALVAGALGAVAIVASPALGQVQGTDTVSIRGHAITVRTYGSRGGTPVVVTSGDGGWIHLGPHVADVLAARGYFVVGVDAMTAEQWDRVLGVNLRGPFLVARAVFPLMQRQGGGDVVNVASTAALRAWGNASAYHASKWGLLGFSRGLGVEGRPDNIRVTTVIPGGMRTHWFDRFPEQGIPLPDRTNLQDPAAVADAIAYAVSLPRGSVVQELLITPLTETSWP